MKNRSPKIVGVGNIYGVGYQIEELKTGYRVCIPAYGKILEKNDTLDEAKQNAIDILTPNLFKR